MTTTTATAFGAIQSVLGTVTTIAQSTSALVNTAGKSIGMLDSFVTNAAQEQAIKQEVAREDFVLNLIRTAAEEQATADARVIEFCSKSPKHAELYAKAHDRYAGLLAKHLPSQQTATAQP